MTGREISAPTPARGPYRAARARFLRIDPLVRYMIVHWVLGALTGLFCAGLLLAIDPFGLRPLLVDSGLAIPALTLLGLGFASTFGGLICAAAVMFPDGYFGGADDEPRGGLKEHAEPRLAYAVKAVRRT